MRDALDRYTSVMAIEPNAVFAGFTEFAHASEEYDTIEFSIKFVFRDNKWLMNPQRFSIWKYGFDPVRHAALWGHALHFFGQAAGSATRDSFDEIKLLRDRSELRYCAFGTEINPSDLQRSRLKVYAGYKYRRSPFLPYILRWESDLKGNRSTGYYEGISVGALRNGSALGFLPKKITQHPDVFFLYKQSGKLHFKIRPGSVSILSDVAKLIDDELQQMFDPVYSLIRDGFAVWVVTFSMLELVRGRIENLTIYLRDANDGHFAAEGGSLGC